MILLGTAGDFRSVTCEGNVSTFEPIFVSLRKLGLTAYEYPFGGGTPVRLQTALAIADAARANGITLSVHAPFTINLATIKPASRENCFRSMLESAKLCSLLGGRRIVVHPGSDRGGHEAALARAITLLGQCRKYLDDQGFSDIAICPETMGKVNTLGTLDDVLALCAADERHIPVLDFAHLHALGQGALKSEEDYTAILQRMIDVLAPNGEPYPDRVLHFHCHFSHVQYTGKGELRHVRFADAGFGPGFSPLCRALKKLRLEPVIICESAGTQAEDASAMRCIVETIFPEAIG